MNRRFFGKKAAGLLAGLGAITGTPKAARTEAVDMAVKRGAMTINQVRKAAASPGTQNLPGVGEYLFLGYEIEYLRDKPLECGQLTRRVTYKFMDHEGKRFEKCLLCFGHSGDLKDKHVGRSFSKEDFKRLGFKV